MNMGMTAYDGLDLHDLHDLVDELTRPHTHREHYYALRAGTTWGRDHVTKVPSLIHQLQHAAPSGEGLERGSGGFKSRPAARVEALDALVRIDLSAARWVRDLGEDDPGDTEACIRLLHGLTASAHSCGRKPQRNCCTRHEIEHDVRRWWHQARIVTGWDLPPWRPDSTCPSCTIRGSLRVRLEDRSGLCAECHEVWDPATYQQLAHHIRTEAEQRQRKPQRARSTTGPCWCPWPQVPAARFVAMCPQCRSVHCRHAVRIDEQTTTC